LTNKNGLQDNSQAAKKMMDFDAVPLVNGAYLPVEIIPPNLRDNSTACPLTTQIK